ncbi:MAG TPA: PA2169 family four-helix-bundle protein [Gemmatimonadaceae bacterium]|nr:PA2169 family four-helix-bundle protein [Gemmatimonadaceae bacterium]
MAMDNDDVISTLNDLIETCEDGVKGFRAAADAAKNPMAKTVFDTRVGHIEQAESELRALVKQLGGDPADRGTATGALHRGWMNIKAASTGMDDDAIIAECERGENAAVERYEDALEKNLPSDVRLVVDRQYRGTLQNRDRVLQLRQTLHGAQAPRSRRPDREAPPPA